MPRVSHWKSILNFPWLMLSPLTTRRWNTFLFGKFSQKDDNESSSIHIRKMMTNMLDEAKMRRLAMIQYTYTMAVEQSHKPEPLNMVSIVLFHDAVELFLALTSEHLNVGKTGKEFMAYWDAISQKLPGSDFGQKDSMKRFNEARVNWKHYGITLPNAEIEDFRSNVVSFFRENTPKVFGFAFEEISMAVLVQEKEVRDRLVKAEQLVSAGEIQSAIQEIAFAFFNLMDGFEAKIIQENSFHLNRPFLSLHSFSHIESVAPKELSKFAKEIEKELSTLHERMKLLSLGIDYRRYIRFQGLAPFVYRTGNGAYHVSPGTGKGRSHHDYLFCYQFVIECALRLQEFQFA